MTNEDKAFIKTVIEERVEAVLRQTIAEEFDKALARFFDTGGDAKEMRRMKAGFEWAANRAEMNKQAGRTAWTEILKWVVGLGTGALTAWIFGRTHIGG